MDCVPSQLPVDVNEQLLERQRRMAAELGVKLTKVSKTGDVLRDVLAKASMAEQHGLVPAVTLDQAQA